MDELVFVEKTYVSSKKAAKLTGYAKDYVGQLCREGKVEARLVGRNWYVLEESVLAHRFGEQEQDGQPSPEVPVANASENIVKYEWNPPTYTAEPVTTLPQPEPIQRAHEVYEPVQPEPEKVEIEPIIKENTLSDMQSAWQEWFAGKKNQERALPDASEMLLKEPEESEKIVEHDYSEPQSHAAEAAAPEPVLLHRVHQDRKAYEDGVYMGAKNTINRRELYPRREMPEVVPAGSRQQKRKVAPARRKRRNSSGALLKVAMICIVGLFVLGTYAAVSSIGESEAGGGNTLFNYINGVSTVQ